MYQYLDPVVGLIDALVLLVGLYDADGCSDVGSFGATTVGRDGLHLPRTERPQPQRTTSRFVAGLLPTKSVIGNVATSPKLCLLKSSPKGKLIALCSSIHLHLFMARHRKPSLLYSCGFLRSSTCRNRRRYRVAKDWFPSKTNNNRERRCSLGLWPDYEQLLHMTNFSFPLSLLPPSWFGQFEHNFFSRLDTLGKHRHRKPFPENYPSSCGFLRCSTCRNAQMLPFNLQNRHKFCIKV